MNRLVLLTLLVFSFQLSKADTYANFGLAPHLEIGKQKSTYYQLGLELISTEGSAEKYIRLPLATLSGNLSTMLSHQHDYYFNLRAEGALVILGLGTGLNYHYHNFFGRPIHTLGAEFSINVFPFKLSYSCDGGLKDKIPGFSPHRFGIQFEIAHLIHPRIVHEH